MQSCENNPLLRPSLVELKDAPLPVIISERNKPFQTSSATYELLASYSTGAQVIGA